MDPVDRVLNPSRLFIRVGQRRWNPVALLLIGAITYLAARNSLESLAVWLGVAFLLWGSPLFMLWLARRGHYQPLYPELTLRQLREQLERDGSSGRLSLDGPEREVLAYLTRKRTRERPSAYFVSVWEAELLFESDRAPFTTEDGRAERKTAIARLLERGYLKPERKLDDCVSLNLRRLAPLLAGS